jgi:Caspase domain/WD domain, G-beta repeat
MRMLLHLFLALLALTSFGAGEARAYRVALVIGNDDYVHLRDLQNAVRDADLIGSTLEEIGFTHVRVLHNATADQIRQEMEQFYRRAAGAEVAFVYFAGHGFTVRRRSEDRPENGYDGYITGIDANGNSADGIAIANALLAAQAASRVVVVINACRSYYEPGPDGRTFTMANLSSSIPGSMYGLRPMEQPQVFFAASTWNGGPAYEGRGRTSEFGQVFAELVRTYGPAQPGFGDRLVAEVSRRTAQNQVPFFISNLRTDGNPLMGMPGPPPRRIASAQMTSEASVEHVTSAAIDRAGRAFALSPAGLSSLSSRRPLLRGTEGTIALAEDGVSALQITGRQIATRRVGGAGSRRRNRVDEAVTLGVVSRTGHYAAATASNRILVSGDLYQEFWFHPANGPVTSLLVSEEGRVVFYGSGDGALCSFTDYMIRERWCMRLPGSVRQIAETPDGSMIMTIEEPGWQSVQLRSGRSLGLITRLLIPDGSNPSHAEFSPDGSLIAAGAYSGRVYFWDLQTADLLFELPQRTGAVRTVRFSPDGDSLILTRSNGSVEVWRLSRS